MCDSRLGDIGRRRRTGSARPALLATMIVMGGGRGLMAQSNDVRGRPMRLRSLLQDEYTFFRGSAEEFGRWCARGCADWIADGGSRVLLHGDAHVGNVGTFSSDLGAAPAIHFGVVDLDETVEGPFQLDLLHALASVRLAVKAEGARLDDDAIRRAAEGLLGAYRAALTGDSPYESVITGGRHVPAILKKAAKNNPSEYVGRYARLDGGPRFRGARLKNGTVKDILDPVDADTRKALVEAAAFYLKEGCPEAVRRRFVISTPDEAAASIVDAVRWTRVSSSGSQGLQKYLLLMRRPLADGPEYLILELKEEPAPGAARAGLLAARTGPDRAADVAGAYRRFFTEPPNLVGHTRIGDRGFLVRLKDPYNEDFEVDDFKLNHSPEGAVEMAETLGASLGLAHRQSLLGDGAGRIAAIDKRCDGLGDVLVERSAAVEAHLCAAYETLRSDAAAQTLAALADEYVTAAAQRGD